MTRRVIRAVEHPLVRILAHPTGRVIGQRDGADLEMRAVIRACIAARTATEINAAPQRLDLRDVHVREAIELGAMLVVNTDAHGADQLSWMRYGIAVARRGWAPAQHILNTRPLSGLLEWLSRP
jgi:DNA polymerase (family 10)